MTSITLRTVLTSLISSSFIMLIWYVLDTYLHLPRHTHRLNTAFVNTPQNTESPPFSPEIVPAVDTCPEWNAFIHTPSNHLDGMAAKRHAWITSCKSRQSLIKITSSQVRLCKSEENNIDHSFQLKCFTINMEA